MSTHVDPEEGLETGGEAVEIRDSEPVAPQAVVPSSSAEELAAGGETTEAPKKEVEEEECTEEEVKWMRDDLLEKAHSLQALIIKLRQAEEDLKEDVQDFLIRDVAEHQVSCALANRVEDAQRRALNNPEYLRWAVQNRKGEFGETDIDDYQPELGPAGSTPWFTAVHPDNRPIAALHIPTAMVAAMADWRKTSPGIVSLKKVFCEYVDALLEDKAVDGGFVFTVNGEPLVDAIALREAVNNRAVVQQFQRMCVGAKSPLEKYNAWMKVVATFTSQQRLDQQLTDTMDQLASFVSSEDDNVLAVISSDDLAKGAIVRAFCVKGQLAALETFDPKIDTLQAAGLGTEVTVVGRVKGFLETHSRALFAVSEPSKAVTLLLLPNKTKVLHLQRLGPDMPFRHHFTWSDVCGVGRMLQSALADPDASSTQFQPAIRRTAIQIAELAPYDELTEIWFPFCFGGKPAPSASNSSRVLSATTMFALGATAAVGAVLLGVMKRRQQ